MRGANVALASLEEAWRLQPREWSGEWMQGPLTPVSPIRMAWRASDLGRDRAGGREWTLAERTASKEALPKQTRLVANGQGVRVTEAGAVVNDVGRTTPRSWA